MRSLIVAALLGVASAADDHCEINYSTYTKVKCEGTETKKDFSALWGTVKDTCMKATGDTTHKSSKMVACSSTKYEY